MTAHQALIDFRKVSSRLTYSQMATEVTGVFWENGGTVDYWSSHDQDTKTLALVYAGVIEPKSRHLAYYARPDENSMALSLLGEGGSTGIVPTEGQVVDI